MTKIILISNRSFASQAQQAETRILPIAPDSFFEAPEVAPFRIMARKKSKLRIVPSLLHACQASRSLSMKSYTLWPCTSSYGFQRDGTYIYVNKAHDTFYFGGRGTEIEDFCYLATADEEVHQPEDHTARFRFFDAIDGVRHIGLDWELWLYALSDEDCRVLWISNVIFHNSEFRHLTIGIHNSFTALLDRPFRDTYHVRSITPGTLRARCASFISAWIKAELATLPQAFEREFQQDYSLPELQVVDLSSNKNEDSPKDSDYLDIILL